jgi:hypothetical protein
MIHLWQDILERNVHYLQYLNDFSRNNFRKILSTITIIVSHIQELIQRTTNFMDNCNLWKYLMNHRDELILISSLNSLLQSLAVIL